MKEAVQWISLGWALVNKPFADRLYREVGPNAFYDGPAGLVYDAIEARADQQEIRDMLGLTPVGKLSEAVLRYLTIESNKAWRLRTRQPGSGKAKFLQKRIHEALAMLLAMARHDEERRPVDPGLNGSGPKAVTR